MFLVLSVDCGVHVCFPIRSPLSAFDVNILWWVWLSDIFSGMIFISRIVCFCWERSRTSIIEVISICDISNGVSNFHKLGLREIGFNSALLVIHWVFYCVVRDSPKFSQDVLLNGIFARQYSIIFSLNLTQNGGLCAKWLPINIRNLIWSDVCWMIHWWIMRIRVPLNVPWNWRSNE